jgi:prepilin-type N-terminal cleavage/methylation domain-containing protein
MAASIIRQDTLGRQDVMTERNRKLEWKRSSGELDQTGFTLIELLIVIVVLGILAAIVVFALGSVTGNADVSACNSDSRTLDIGVQAYLTENPLASPASSNAASPNWETDLLGTALGGPYVQTWPGTSNGYTIVVAGAGDTQALAGADSSDTIALGDILVDVTTGSHQGWYDFTQDSGACSNI